MKFIGELIFITFVISSTKFYVSSTQISCKYSKTQQIFGSRFYQCEVKSIKPIITSPGTKIKIHNINRPSETIKAIFIEKLTINFFPSGIGTVFKKLEFISIINSHLKEIFNENLAPFNELRILVLSQNELSKIDRKTFNDNLKLEVINLSDNKIQFIDPNAFDGLTNLNLLFLENNFCIDKVYQMTQGIQNIARKDFEAKCAKNNAEGMTDNFVINDEAKISQMSTKNTKLKIVNRSAKNEQNRRKITQKTTQISKTSSTLGRESTKFTKTTQQAVKTSESTEKFEQSQNHDTKMTTLQMTNLISNKSEITNNKPQMSSNIQKIIEQREIHEKPNENLSKIGNNETYRNNFEGNVLSQELNKTIEQIQAKIYEIEKKFKEIEHRDENKLDPKYAKKIEQEIKNIEQKLQQNENKTHINSEKGLANSLTIKKIQEQIESIEKINKVNFSKTHENFDEFSKNSFKNFTHLENLVIKNEEIINEILDQLENYEKLQQEIENIKNDKTNLKIEEKLTKKIDKIEKKFSNDKIKDLKEKVDKIQKELELFNIQSAEKNLKIKEDAKKEETKNVNLKIEKLEHKNEKLEKEAKTLVYSGIGLLSFLVILIVLIFILSWQRDKVKSSNENTEEARPNNERRNSTEMLPFSILDAEKFTNPFRNDFCIDGTQMYNNDIVQYENWSKGNFQTFGHPQNFYVNQSTENILDEAVYGNINDQN
ncbi:hypothetical protein PVAND_016016 [Polypedilum vanderplanki]|uniref:Uncharacterized protein n=1 Tax=Polypedilum vanderplanki TaxID=319348 RepID=A0A9J6BDX2_POLVA|nr:hypothetical protein PVAND_016016 [Polypedilum vanderplanki]